MVLDDVQSLVVAYIYGVNKDTMQYGKEVLIKAGGDKQIFGDRRTLKTLVPRSLIDQEIFIPINDNNLHWFLLVIDINKEQLILLDSYRNSGSDGLRKRLVRQMDWNVDEENDDDDKENNERRRRNTNPTINQLSLLTMEKRITHRNETSSNE
ncbi:hypothetical protein Fmac_027887 [Flemingia macrophylla]|uniref:Ubiquitin-like protease family profile domain-containing protein n=1 Tax=Flemingia macrophylla TaxID=520843 RepID=A0ABD1LJK7_9FABA